MLTQFFFNILAILTNAMPGNNFGLAILVLTLLVQLALWPLRVKAIDQQRKMQVLTPHMKRLQVQHKDDKQALAKAMSDLYRQFGVKPVGSCLLQLAQLPILIVLYQIFLLDLTKVEPSLYYSFVPHLTSVGTSFLGLEMTARPNVFVAGLVALSQFIQTKRMIGRQDKDSTDPKKKDDDFAQAFQGQMTYLFPVMTFIFSIQFPAALSVYWLTMTLFGIGQQEWLYKKTPEPIKVMGQEIAPAHPRQETVHETVETKKNVTVTVRKKLKS